MESRIRPSLAKEYSDYAVVGDDIAGGSMSEWSINSSDMIAEYSFDIAVFKKYRGRDLVGVNLINEAIKGYELNRSMYEEMGYDTIMRLWVVNPRLVKFLEKNKDFEIESQYSDGSAHMTYMN